MKIEQKVKEICAKTREAKAGDSMVYMPGTQYTQNVWSMNLRNHKLHDKIQRSKCLKDKNRYPSTCYSPRVGISYDNAYIDVNELYK